jgi:hypothetical protein
MMEEKRVHSLVRSTSSVEMIAEVQAAEPNLKVGFYGI